MRNLAPNKNESYWEKACIFFSEAGLIDSENSYFIHNKYERKVYIGMGCQTKISVGVESLSCSIDGLTEVYDLESEVLIFKRVKQFLINGAPSFFMISPDFNRKFIDSSIPCVLFVQPVVEFTFSTECRSGWVSYAKNSDEKVNASIMLDGVLGKLEKQRIDSSDNSVPFSSIIAQWKSTEEDEEFLKRIDDGISLLDNFPNGKMTLTRSYTRKLQEYCNPFELYKFHARWNGDYACSHFFNIGGNNHSLGCTPENVFTINDRKLLVDVVAGTCKACGNEHIKSKLTRSYKQIKEHKTSLSSRSSRYESYCIDDSLEIASTMDVKYLKNVAHLYSVISGKLLPGVTMFDLLGTAFPLLSARPKELLPFYESAEVGPHRYYSGIVGRHKDRSSTCFLNIRNALISENVIHAKVGIGLISESDPYDELLEARNKISGLMEAVYFWERQKSV